MMPIENSSPRQRGLSLIEVLVAVSLVAISLPALMYVQKGSWTSSTQSVRTSRAVQLIEKQSQMLRVSFPPASSTSGFREDGIQVSWVVSDDPFVTSNPNLREVQFVAAWKAGGKPDSLRVKTILAKDF